jgi:hypothetical protein
MADGRLKVEVSGGRFEYGVPTMALAIRDGLSCELDIDQAKQLVEVLTAAIAEAERSLEATSKLPQPAIGGVEARGRLSGL